MRRVSSLMLWFLADAALAQPVARVAQYAEVQDRLQRGWGTWDTNSVISQVLLPMGLEIQLGIKRATSENSDAFLSTALIGRRGARKERVTPGIKSYDGSYSELRLSWQGIDVELQTAQDGGDLLMLVTPLGHAPDVSLPATAVFSAGMLWNQPGSVAYENSRIVARAGTQEVSIFVAGDVTDDRNVPVVGPHFTLSLSRAVGLSTGRRREIEEMSRFVAAARSRITEPGAKDPQAFLRSAVQTVVAWDTIYEPQGRRILTPVSRIWNRNWGGYVLFEWDTFFAAALAAVDNRDLAYANVIELLNETTPAGMSPNFARAAGWKSFDRSEPPVGAITVLALYRQYRDRWLLQATYDRLMQWNAWWPSNRAIGPYLVWGSNRAAQPVNPDDPSVGTVQGARYESGLDNSPMYDNVGFDEHQQLMLLADVGLMSLYVADCDALAEIAAELGRTADIRTLRARAQRFRAGLQSLWDPASAIYRNKDLRTGQLSPRLSPTNFYPLLAHAADSTRADAMISKHLLNPAEFWGERVVPSIARNDPAFTAQDYWRGRIWGPMNYLLWLGLGNYHSPLALDAREQLARRSRDLFLEDWVARGHVHENYSATGPDNDGVTNSDAFYHWGALLALMSLNGR